MIHHVDHEHSDLHKPKVDTVAKTKPLLMQPKLEFYTRKTQADKLTKKEKEKLDDTLMKMVVSKSLPLSIVDHVFFREFVALLDSRFVQTK